MFTELSCNWRELLVKLTIDVVIISDQACCVVDLVGYIHIVKIFENTTCILSSGQIVTIRLFSLSLRIQIISLVVVRTDSEFHCILQLFIEDSDVTIRNTFSLLVLIGEY